MAASVVTEFAARSPTLDLKPTYCKTLMGNDTTEEMAPALNALGSRSLMDHSSPFKPLMMASTHMVSMDSITKGGTESIPANCKAYWLGEKFLPKMEFFNNVEAPNSHAKPSMQLTPMLPARPPSWNSFLVATCNNSYAPRRTWRSSSCLSFWLMNSERTSSLDVIWGAHEARNAFALFWPIYAFGPNAAAPARWP